MKPSELVRRAHDVQIVDVRYPNEWDAGHIDGAVHLPVDDLAERAGKMDPGRPVITVCRTGDRSTAAAETLRTDGFVAESLDGGMEAWARDGLPIVSGEGEPGTVVAPEPPPDDWPPEHQRLQDELLSVLFALQDRFGDHEPADEEVRAFLRDRLISQGKSPVEADEFLERMGER